MAAFLLAVNEVVGCVEVEDDFAVVLREALGAELNKCFLDVAMVRVNLVIVRRTLAILRLSVGDLKAVERRLANQWVAFVFANTVLSEGAVFPTAAAMRGSRRSFSWSLRSSNPAMRP